MYFTNTKRQLHYFVSCFVFVKRKDRTVEPGSIQSLNFNVDVFYVFLKKKQTNLIFKPIYFIFNVVIFVREL